MEQVIIFAVEVLFLVYGYAKLREYLQEGPRLKDQLEQERLLRLSLEVKLKDFEQSFKNAQVTIARLKEHNNSIDETNRKREERNRILKYGTIEDLRAWRKAQ